MTWILALPVPHTFAFDNGIRRSIYVQHESKSNVVKSPQTTQHRLGAWRFFGTPVECASETGDYDACRSDTQVLFF